MALRFKMLCSRSKLWKSGADWEHCKRAGAHDVPAIVYARHILLEGILLVQ